MVYHSILCHNILYTITLYCGIEYRVSNHRNLNTFTTWSLFFYLARVPSNKSNKCNKLIKPINQTYTEQQQTKTAWRGRPRSSGGWGRWPGPGLRRGRMFPVVSYEQHTCLSVWFDTLLQNHTHLLDTLFGNQSYLMIWFIKLTIIQTYCVLQIIWWWGWAGSVRSRRKLLPRIRGNHLSNTTCLRHFLCSKVANDVANSSSCVRQAVP